MTMYVKRIRDLIKEGLITVKDPNKGFTVADLCDGYLSNSDDGSSTDSVFGFGNRLNIRPSFQRNNVYNDEKRNAVIQTILNKCPLNTMYWVDMENGKYECLDGQQRTLAICKYLCGEFAVSSPLFPSNLAQDFPNLQTNLNNIAQDILDYELDIYVCKGTPAEKMLWFHVINTSGEPLNEQELRNSSYTGMWLSDAKARFSSSNGRGVVLANINPNNNQNEPLLSGSWNRQEFLQTALDWISNSKNTTIESYMLNHRGDSDASELWQYFSQVLEWVRGKFITYNSALKGMNWGEIYKNFNEGKYNNSIIQKSASEIQSEIIRLNNDKEVTAKMSGIYKYIITGEQKYLQLRTFDESIARAVYEKQKHMCIYCQQEGINKEYAFKEMEADHIQPWSKGGKTEESNCQMLCKKHNASKRASY